MKSQKSNLPKTQNNDIPKSVSSCWRWFIIDVDVQEDCEAPDLLKCS